MNTDDRLLDVFDRYGKWFVCPMMISIPVLLVFAFFQSSWTIVYIAIAIYIVVNTYTALYDVLWDGNTGWIRLCCFVIIFMVYNFSLIIFYEAFEALCWKIRRWS